VCLCKGQNGIGEEIWRDDRIVALCDWELAHLGDPCHDLGPVAGHVEASRPRRRDCTLMSRLRASNLPAENVAFFLVWNAFKSLLTLNNGLRSFLDGQNTRLPRATLGFGKVKVYEHLLGAILDMDLEEASEFIPQRTAKSISHEAGGRRLTCARQLES
jgi:hypothetical protein